MLERLSAACHHLTHFHGSLAPAQVGRDKDDRLGRVVEHDLHLIAVVEARLHISGQHHRHAEVNLGQGILDAHSILHVLKQGRAPLAGAVIENVQAVRPPTKVGVVSPGPDGDLTAPVVQGHPPGNQGQRLGYHMLRNPDADAVGLCTALDQQVTGLRKVDIHTNALQDLQARLVDPLPLLQPQTCIVRAGHAVPMSLYHHSPLASE